MGGIWGLAASTALENLPVEARGIASGVLQQGYAVGYLIAAVISLELVPRTSTSWRTSFWTACGISTSAAVLRMLLPESSVFLKAKAEEQARGSGMTTGQKTKVFLRETGEMLKTHWMLCIYAILLMTGTLLPPFKLLHLFGNRSCVCQASAFCPMVHKIFTLHISRPPRAFHRTRLP